MLSWSQIIDFDIDEFFIENWMHGNVMWTIFGQPKYNVEIEGKNIEKTFDW
jgi:hypothetical protein